jgi:hypothetical protein
MKNATQQQGQSSLFDGLGDFAEPEPEVALDPEGSCSTYVSGGERGTAAPSAESPAEGTDQQPPNITDEEEDELQQKGTVKTVGWQ